MPKKTYTDEFKTDAVNYYYDSGLSINTTAKKLGVSVSALRKWIKLSKKDGSVITRVSGNYSSDKDKEIARLKRQLRDAEGAIEVLKKVISILG